MVIATGIFMNRGVNMPFISVSLPSVKSGMIGTLCWMGTSARHTASFIRWEDWRYHRITPSWHWPKIISRRQYGVRFRNLQSGNWYPEVLENVEADLVWANDSQTFYYVRKHETTLLPYQVWRHTVGSPSSLDELVYEEADDMFYVSLHKTTSLHYVVIHIASATTSEVLLLDAELADAEPLVF